MRLGAKLLLALSRSIDTGDNPVKEWDLNCLSLLRGRFRIRSTTSPGRPLSTLGADSDFNRWGSWKRGQVSYWG